MNGKIESNVIDYLVDRKFKRVGDAPFPSFEEWRERRRGTLVDSDSEGEAAYRLELGYMSLPALNTLFEQTEQEAVEQRQRAEIEDRTRFFNQPKAQADFDYWSTMPRWTLDEATALSFGKAPEFVNKVKAYHGQFALPDDYRKRRNLLLRGREVGDLRDLISPAEFISWAEQNGVTLPQELMDAVRASAGRIEDRRSLTRERDELREEVKRLKEEAAREKPLSTRERETYRKIIYGMAIKGYAHNPTGRSGAPQEIADDLEALGIGVSVDTVRNKLDEASRELSLLPEVLETLKRKPNSV